MVKRLPAISAWILCVLGSVLAAPQLLAQTGSISASPNPCTIASGKSTCTTTLSWSATGISRLRVQVSHNGAAATNFATSGSSGSQSASWIQAAPSHTYTFSLHDYSGGSVGTRLDSVTVTGKAATKPKPKPPTISFFSATPSSIDKGKTSTLKWSTSNADSVSISPGIGTVKAQGYRVVSPTSTTTYTLTATNTAKAVKATTKVTVRPIDPPTATFSASPETIDKGKSSTLKWNTTDATSVFISPGIGTVKASGTRTVSPSSTTTYTLTASNSVKTVKVTAKVTVRKPTPPPISGTISASPNPCTIAEGKSTCTTTLKWSATGTSGLRVRVSHNGRASTVVSSSGASGSTSPSWIQAAPAHTYTFTLYDYAGRVQGKLLDSVKVTGKAAQKPPTISSFTASPTTIDSGQSSTLKWSTANADSLSISPGVGKVTGTSVSVSPTSTTTYTLTAKNTAKSVTATAKVTVRPPPAPKISSFTASPATIDKGKSSTLKWSTANATSLSISPGVGTVTGTLVKVSPTSTMTYTLTATNSVKTVTATVKVTVRGTPTTVSGAISASPNPCAIAAGKYTCTSTISWTVQNTSRVRVVVSRNGGRASIFATATGGDSQSASWIREAPANTYKFSLYDYTGGSLGALLDSVTVTGRREPTISYFTVSPTSINSGGSATLLWSTANADSVSIDQGIGTVSARGSLKVSPTSTTTYTLTATNTVKTVTATVKVTVRGTKPAPTISSFTASPASIDKGKSATLSWSAANADSLSISPGVGTVTGTSVKVSPTSTTTYTLTATNAAKSVTATVKVTVRGTTPAPTISSFTATPSTIASGESSTLRWKTSDADTLSITPGPGTLTDTLRRLYAIRPLRVSPSETTTYTLKATNTVKSVTATVKVTVGPPKISGTISSATLNPCAIETGKDTCAATIQWTVKNTKRVKVYVSANGDAATLFATATGDGRRKASGIKGSPNKYVFSLYDYTGDVRGALLGSVTVTGRRVPTGTFTASPTTIDQGKSATLSWSTANADTVFISPGVGSVNASGTVKVSPNSTTTYTLNVTNAVRSVKLKVTVTVRKRKAPTISSFTATPSTIDKGQSATLRWSTTDAEVLSINPGPGILTETLRRLYAIRPLRVSPTATTTYTLKATNAVKTVTATVTVTVREPAVSGTITVEPDPCTIYHGQTTCTPTVTWESTGATEVQVWYSLNDGEEQHLASSAGGGPHSRESIPLKATDTIVFKLYDYSGGTRQTLVELAQKGVTIQLDIGCPPPSD